MNFFPFRLTKKIMLFKKFSKIKQNRKLEFIFTTKFLLKASDQEREHYESMKSMILSKVDQY